MTIAAGLVPALLLLACGRAEEARNEVKAAPVAANVVQKAAPPPAAPPAVAVDGLDDGTPDLTPPRLTPEAERGVQGARNVLLSFARAIEHKEYGQAWALLSPGDRQSWSRPAFAAMFAGWREASVAIPDGETDGAAGSIYYTAPITIAGTDKDGRPVRYEGQAVLKRVNDVDGATAAQLRWHFDRLTLDWTH